MAWHHIIEQHADNIARFGPEMIHYSDNLLRVPHGAGTIHQMVTNHYNSLMSGTGVKVGDYVKTLDYEAQLQYGLETLKKIWMETIDKLKENFLKNALAYSECISGDNDYKVVNKIMKKLQKLYNLTKEDSIHDFFQDFINHEDESVRYLSATYLIKSKPDLAERTLKELIESPTIIGLNAKTTLDMWQKGMLNLL